MFQISFGAFWLINKLVIDKKAAMLQIPAKFSVPPSAETTGRIWKSLWDANMIQTCSIIMCKVWYRLAATWK